MRNLKKIGSYSCVNGDVNRKLSVDKKHQPLSILCYVLIHRDLTCQRLLSFPFYLENECEQVHNIYLSKKREEPRF